MCVGGFSCVIKPLYVRSNLDFKYVKIVYFYYTILSTHTHTHTHIYIYIYIYIEQVDVCYNIIPHRSLYHQGSSADPCNAGPCSIRTPVVTYPREKVTNTQNTILIH